MEKTGERGRVDGMFVPGGSGGGGGGGKGYARDCGGWEGGCDSVNLPPPFPSLCICFVSSKLIASILLSCL